MSSKLEKDVAWNSSIRGILYKQIFVKPKALPPSASLSKQTGMITGANSGIGLEAARQALELGLSRLVMAVRSQAKGDEAARKLSEEFPQAEVNVWIVDLADYDSVVALANRCRDSLECLDFAILNAGVQLSDFTTSDKTGHEMTIQANYLSNVLLALLLSKIMKEKKSQRGDAGKPPIISVVGSDTMYLSKFEASGPILPFLDDPTRYTRFEQYRDSKLLLMMFIAKLAEKISPDSVIINVSNPGLTANTGLGKSEEQKAGLAARLLVPVFIKAVGRPLKVGASNYIHALLEEGTESHGSFVSDWEISS